MAIALCIMWLTCRPSMRKSHVLSWESETGSMHAMRGKKYVTELSDELEKEDEGGTSTTAASSLDVRNWLRMCLSQGQCQTAMKASRHVINVS